MNSSGLGTNRTPGLTACKVTTGAWHSLLVRLAGGRIELWVDGALKAAWGDADGTLPLSAAGFGLMTIDGAASFDDVKVYGLSAQSYYIFGAARVAERVTTLAKTAGAGDLYALHADHLGSVSLATDASGYTVTASLARFFPFGAERGAAASGSPTDFAYATGRKAAGLGLVHLGARWYDGQLARWTSADTIVPGSAPLAAGMFDSASKASFADTAKPTAPQLSCSLNRYAYVGDSPTHANDPDGHCWPICTTLIGAGIGAAVGGIAYSINVAATNSEWKLEDAAVAVGVGAAAGGVIGLAGPLAASPAIAAGAAATLGVGTGAVTAAGTIGLGYGVGSAANQLAYYATTPSFDQTDLRIASNAGGVSGAAIAAIPGGGPIAAGASGVIGALANQEQYLATERNHGRVPTAEGVSWASTIGFVGGAAGGPLDAPLDDLLFPGAKVVGGAVVRSGALGWFYATRPQPKEDPWGTP